MKKIFSFLLLPVAALLVTGCLREITYNYVYRNDTNRTIEVTGYYERNNAVEMDCYFSVAPKETCTLSGTGFANHFYFPFQGCNRIKLSDGERTVLLMKTDKPSYEWHCLFRMDCYAKSSRNHTIWRTYTFTDRDFEDGVPIND
ncbi:MAG TPA: hypothetical protein H9866_02980 [Candidatus Tidjanibacter gallistercoris]|nr:hypothetical protein [Candidatus Tidjanibacter gallistercoris]